MSITRRKLPVLVSYLYQSLGLGPVARRVIQVARDEKLSRVSSEMMRDNCAMQILSKRLGFQLAATPAKSPSAVSNSSFPGSPCRRGLLSFWGPLSPMAVL